LNSSAHAATPIVYKEPTVVSFASATFEFSYLEVRDKLTASVRTTKSSGKTRAALDSIGLSFRNSTVTIDRAALEDISSPNLLRFSSSIVPLDDRHVLIAIYLIDDDAECAKHVPPSCGVVEFDWKVGDSLKKLDFRK